MPKNKLRKQLMKEKKIKNNDSKEQRGDRKLRVKEHRLNDFAVRKMFLN